MNIIVRGVARRFPRTVASRQMIRLSLDATNTMGDIKTVLAAVNKTTAMLRA